MLRVLDSKSPQDQPLIAEAPRLEAYLTTEASERFAAVLDGLEALGIRYRRNTRLVRGLVRFGACSGLCGGCLSDC